MILESKFLVLKNEDIAAGLTKAEQIILRLLCYRIKDYRESQGKHDNKYVIINQDEPYFPEILKLMEEAVK